MAIILHCNFLHVHILYIYMLLMYPMYAVHSVHTIACYTGQFFLTTKHAFHPQDGNSQAQQGPIENPSVS